MNILRHGDVLLKEVKGIKATGKKIKEHVLAEGEVTGHNHKAYGEMIPFKFKEKDYIKAITPLRLLHQEHNEIEIPVGTYEIVFEREYDPFKEEFKKVVD